MHNRKIIISKEKLKNKLLENKAKHIQELEKAKELYRSKAKEEIARLTKELEEGSLELYFHMVSPIDRTKEFDKIIEMFDWDVHDRVELTEAEFNDYVHDDNNSSRTAFLSNSTYFASH